MNRISNALAAGAIGAFALAAPVMTPAQASASDVTELKPCKHGKCHHGHHNESPSHIPGGILNDDLTDDRMPGGGAGGIDH
ncbi:hypothetical protein ACFY19_14620 [Streptosporangium saharense]|uniref:Spy/CpxP family protein refolding chaperone n=1 Tax=Streptosporangium saharense TaxID=1706840 RepID=A0A7W7QVD3_9ACTN|nr:hypothetical protein [Streptosporangium saharense]MBB4920477.1 Spy/CpxP family protein refolding chaperone [Streptosporangium saharense]